MTTNRDLFLRTAASIGRRIARQAVWSGNACTWMVTAGDPAAPDSRHAVRRPANGSVYNGTAGIALFLADRRVAEGAVAHALAQPVAPRTAFGFHGGQVGTAYAAARAGIVLDRGDLVEAAARVLAPLAGSEADEAGLDVIAGAAGAIPALLSLGEVLDRGFVTRMAAALGESVIARVQVEPGGWAWGEPVQALHARHLCGVAHGASGMGHALMELYHATGDARCRYGAEQAFAYERQFFDPAEENWLDLRHPLVGDLRSEERRAELRARVLAGEPGVPYQPRFTSAWCQGAPGIAMTRLRAWEVTGRALYRDEARAGLAATLRSVEGGRETLSHSLCHGLSGNAVALLHGACTLGRPELREAAERVGREGAERFEQAGVPWPCGTVGGAADPGLMLGEAGIGWFHLRLCADDVPPVLLPTSPLPAAAERAATRPAAEARRRADAEAYFARTLRVLRASSADAGDPLPPPEACTLRGTVAATYEALRSRVEGEADGEARARLRDAFRLERERYEMTLAITDFTEEYLRATVGAQAPPAAWETAEFRLAPEVRLVETERDWDADEADPPPDGAVHLLYRAQNRIQARRLNPLSALVLRELEREPGTAAAVAARIADALPEAPRDTLAERVRRQLEQLHRGRLVAWSPAAVPA
ncbi:MAG TPA: PqqD family peptide modification chaperone [Longimicrobium sp.]|nr:PqqD family peptide modification chaperone [Longimicrobium sp.]